MNLNFQNIKDTFAILAFVAVIILLGYFNGCNRQKYDVVALSNTSKEKAIIQEAEYAIDSLLCVIDSLKKVKQPIEERIKIRKVYITEKSDTVRKLIKDSTVLAYVDTLEAQVADQDSVIKIQVAEILKLDEVVAKKDTIISNKDIIQAKTEQDIELLQSDIKKKDRKIKSLKIQRVVYPAIAIIGGIYLSLKL